jgi:hypothetical protein
MRSQLIESRGGCGVWITHSVDDLGCIECGQRCRATRGMSPESAVYRARAFRELPGDPRVGVAV